MCVSCFLTVLHLMLLLEGPFTRLLVFCPDNEDLLVLDSRVIVVQSGTPSNGELTDFVEPCMLRANSILPSSSPVNFWISGRQSSNVAGGTIILLKNSCCKAWV